MYFVPYNRRIVKYYTYQSRFPLISKNGANGIAARFTKDLHVRKEQKQLHHKKNIVPFSLRIVKHAQRNW
jgi:hypothetical protein